MIIEIEVIVVDAEHDRHISITHWCGHDDVLGTRSEMLRCGFTGVEYAGGLNHDINAKIAPRQSLRIAFRKDLETIPIHDHVSVDHLNSPRVATVDRVVPEQVGIRLDIPKIVDCNDVDAADRGRDPAPRRGDRVDVCDDCLSDYENQCDEMQTGRNDP